MEVNYQEQEMAERYINAIVTKRKEGFTDEQIAKDLSLPLEVVERCMRCDEPGTEHPGFSDLPDNPAEDDTELPIQNEEKESNDKLEVKEEYTLEQSAEDMFSDDFRDRLKAEYAQTKIRYSRLASYIAEVKAKIAAGVEVDMYESLDLLEIQLTAMGTYITVLSKRLKIINIIETKEEQNNE